MVYESCYSGVKEWHQCIHVVSLACLKWKLSLYRKTLFRYGSWIVTFKILREIRNGINVKKTLQNKNSKIFPHSDGFIITAEAPLESRTGKLLTFRARLSSCVLANVSPAFKNFLFGLGTGYRPLQKRWSLSEGRGEIWRLYFLGVATILTLKNAYIVSSK